MQNPSLGKGLIHHHQYTGLFTLEFSYIKDYLYSIRSDTLLFTIVIVGDFLGVQYTFVDYYKGKIKLEKLCVKDFLEKIELKLILAMTIFISTNKCI